MSRWQHDVDNLGILRPVTKLAIAPAADVEIESVLRRAVRLATAAPYGPVAVEIPVSSITHTTGPPRFQSCCGSLLTPTASPAERYDGRYREFLAASTTATAATHLAH